jgi:hydrogenase maturation protease
MTVPPVFVVGYGNPMRGDDGVGQEAAQALAEGAASMPALAGANIVWAHQLLPEMAADVHEAGYCVFIDAAYDNRPPGAVTVRLLSRPRPSGERRARFSGCWQDLTPEGLLDLTCDLHGSAPAGAVVAVTAGCTNAGFGLSPAVAAAVPRAVAAVRLVVATGHPLVQGWSGHLSALAQERPEHA